LPLVPGREKMKNKLLFKPKIYLRMKEYIESGLVMTKFLEKHPAIKRVVCPTLLLYSWDVMTSDA
jgi:hypothetical protein